MSSASLSSSRFAKCLYRTSVQVLMLVLMKFSEDCCNSKQAIRYPKVGKQDTQSTISLALGMKASMSSIGFRTNQAIVTHTCERPTSTHS